MTQILERLVSFGEFEVVYFGDECILTQEVEAWPLCDWCALATSLLRSPRTSALAHAPRVFAHACAQPDLLLQRGLPA
jgi:inositol hexakisphosphate/diphosphoinositol-pentakisphosphate kinase